ncbi:MULTISPECIES: hypothetical protein [unclassified Phenylobacterium]|uniref:hypothetical protein n=1 Tax=unclassified Phenylobacterium TaxID=2640670 RepID=UPI00083B4C1F|nr:MULTISPECIES: hypothetical protein [unclassified Phenylobacterium]
MRIPLYAAGLSLVLACAAQAQAAAGQPGAVNPAPPTSPAPTAPASPPAVDTSATTSPYKTGMPIKDAQGATIGTIARVIRTPDGATTISASVDGRNVNLPASALSPSADGGAVSSMSKAEITASTLPPT